MLVMNERPDASSASFRTFPQLLKQKAVHPPRKPGEKNPDPGWLKLLKNCWLPCLAAFTSSGVLAGSFTYTAERVIR